jgi:hypothetical protein
MPVTPPPTTSRVLLVPVLGLPPGAIIAFTSAQPMRM